MLFAFVVLLGLVDALDIFDSSFDPAISNGTCYSSLENRLDDRFLPCGNSALGVQSCCWHGDFCLVNAACFGIHDNSYVTYLAGCTDIGYRHPRCPSKGTNDAWVGLAYCDDSLGNWEACAQSGHPTTLAAAGPCSCPSATASRTIGEFGVGSTISVMASLPSTAGGTLSWASPFGPVTIVTPISLPGMTESGTLTTTVIWRTTTTSDSSFGLTSVGGADPITSSTSSTSTSTMTSWSIAISLTGEPISASSPTHTVSTSAAATSPPAASSPSRMSLILGTSLGFGAALLILLVSVVFLLHRRRTQQGKVVSEVGPDDAESAKTTPAATAQPALTTPIDVSPISPTSELETHPARPWSLRSELADNNDRASQSITTVTASTPTWKMISELEG